MLFERQSVPIWTSGVFAKENWVILDTGKCIVSCHFLSTRWEDSAKTYDDIKDVFELMQGTSRCYRTHEKKYILPLFCMVANKWVTHKRMLSMSFYELTWHKTRTNVKHQIKRNKIK